MIKKPSKKNLILACILLTAMFAVVAWMTRQDSTAAPSPSTSVSTSAETPAATEKEPTDPTPALIGGGAAIVLYYVGSLAVDALKKKRTSKNNSDGDTGKK